MPDRGRHSAGRRRSQQTEESRTRRSLGPRRAALTKRRKKVKKRGFTGGAATVVVIVAVVVVALLLPEAAQRLGSDPEPQTPDAPTDSVTTTLLIGTREQQGGSDGVAAWLTLLSYNANEQSGAIVYIPSHTAVEVPGRGLQGVGEALASGGISLLLVSVENMLGVEVDNYIEISDADAGLLFRNTGDISVDVPREVRVAAGANQARLLLDDGLQKLPPQFLVELLYTVGLDGDEAELGTRHVAFWDALLGAYASDPAGLGDAVAETNNALNESNASAEQQASFFSRLASLNLDDVRITPLPVQQEVVGDSELYSTNQTELKQFVRDTVGVLAETTDDVRVQVLNGNGVPGIGQEVAARLVGEGFKVILSGNAQSLDHAKTLIVTYDSSREGQAIAERARELLGIGEVQVSAQQQGIVDLTIVVGKDWLGTTDQDG